MAGPDIEKVSSETDGKATSPDRAKKDLRWRKGLKIGLWVISTLAITAILFEIAYRTMVVDFYATELNALNPPADLEAKKPGLLVMGDSFSATQESYLRQLRDSLPQYSIINSAIPGTGVLQATYLARRRFSRFQPKIFVYQIYVGNDLLDIRPPFNWEKLSRTRNFYWRLSTDLRSVAYLNYKLGQYKSSFGGQAPDSLLKKREFFSPGTYNARERMLITGEPKFIEHSVQLRDQRAEDFLYYREVLRRLLSRCRTGECEAFVLVIPHCAQVSDGYLGRMRQLGAAFDTALEMDAHDYPFYRELRLFIDAPNMHFVNPLPALQLEEKNQPMYYADDPHLSPAGQQVVAKVLLDSLSGYLRHP